MSTLRARRPRAASSPIGVAATALLLGGCAGPTRIALPAEARSRIPSARTVALLIHDDSRASGAAQAALRQALQCHDASAALAPALLRELAPLAWLKDGAIEVRLAREPLAGGEWARQGAADTTLLIRAAYRLTHAAAALELSATVEVRSRTIASSAISSSGLREGPRPGGPLFANAIHILHPLPDAATPSAAAPGPHEGTAGSGDLEGGRVARAALDASLNELARMVAFDLEQGAPAPGTFGGAAGAQTVLVNWLPGRAPESGVVVRQQGGRHWLRLRSGALCVLL